VAGQPDSAAWALIPRPCVDCGDEAAAYRCATCHREFNRLRQLRRRIEKPEVVRADALWRLYKIRLADYDALRIAQGYRCAICGIHEDEVDTSKVGGRKTRDGRPSIKATLHVDHDHGSGKIRQLLCPHCNRGLADFKENPAALRAAAEYVERHASLDTTMGYVRARDQLALSPAHDLARYLAEGMS
jgi:Recombination endonuclease VII